MEEEDFDRPYWVPTQYEAEYGDHIPQGIANARRDVEGKGQFVLFTDILGFAYLVEQDEKAHVRWAAGLSGLRASMRTRPPSPLSMLFEAFHGAVETTLVEARNLNLKEPAPWRPPAIVFSDSAFIMVPWLNLSVDIARRLMRNLISNKVPARMGLGFGGFSATRFSTETRRQQTHHVSEFYGTSVIRAHHAESCGVPGMRILLHPSVVGKLSSDRVLASSLLPLPAAKQAGGISHELNYVEDTLAAGLIESVLAMKSSAPQAVHRHYDETLEAIERMKKLA